MNSGFEDQSFTNVGSFPAWEAQRLIKTLEDADIPFEIETSDAAIRDQNVLIAQAGGTFGDGAKITIYVSSSYVDSFTALHNQVSGNKPEYWPEHSCDKQLVIRPSFFALLGYWIILGFIISVGIALEIGLWHTANFIVLILDAILCIFLGFFLYRITQDHFRTTKKAEQDAAANP